ncbi:MAG TPA: citrate synthase [Gammaproteobacteria bacterium]|nr:citrate synthase [Gammaproteobacteria bacterium]
MNAAIDSFSAAAANGLEGIPAATTALSDVQGDVGRLILCGRDLADFAAGHGFESAAAEFWAVARAEPAAPAETVRAALGAGRAAAYARFLALRPALEALTLSEGLRLGLASLSEGTAPHIAATAAVPVFVANVARLKEGHAPVAPDPARPHVEDFLRMLRGGAPSGRDVEALSTYLVTVMDHGMNASTFTARVIASTQANLVSAVVGAYAALTGPLHGGAPEPVLEMLDAIGRPERAAAWLEQRLAAGGRIMGFGHRIYRVRDPRADVLKAALEKLGAGNEKLELARAVETAALAALRRHKPERKLDTNVEFYTAMLLDALGIPRAAFTPVFAMGRVVGWTAHAFEQRRTGRLIRPASLYVGRTPARADSKP